MKIILTFAEIEENAFVMPITDLDYIREARNLIALQFPSIDVEFLLEIGTIEKGLYRSMNAVEFDIIPIKDLQP